MKIKDMKKEQLETLSYTDLTEYILKERKRGMNTSAIFKKIAKLLDLTDDEYAAQIGDFYTSLTTDKRFTLVNNVWDLRDRHAVDIIMENDEDEDDEEEQDDSVVETVESENIESMEDEEGIESDGKITDDLTIIDEDDMDDE